MSRENVDLRHLAVNHRTADAILVVNLNLEDVWLPMSQIEDFEVESHDPYVVSIEIPQWLAEEKGLI